MSTPYRMFPPGDFMMPGDGFEYDCAFYYDQPIMWAYHRTDGPEGNIVACQLVDDRSALVWAADTDYQSWIDVTTGPLSLHEFYTRRCLRHRHQSFECVHYDQDIDPVALDYVPKPGVMLHG